MNLNELYEQWIIEYHSKVRDYEKSNAGFESASPLLISDTAKNMFANGDIKVLFFGQETNGWYSPFLPNVEQIQGYYDQFYTSRYCYRYGGQFWNGTKRLHEIMTEHIQCLKIEYLWNNLVKTGKDEKGCPPREFTAIERNYFNVIPKEVSIIQPDIIIFFTGPHYDGILNEVFPEIETEPVGKFTKRQLSRAHITNSCICYRTYHPNYLWRHGINEYFHEMSRDIKEQLTKSGLLTNTITQLRSVRSTYMNTMTDSANTK